jgi:DNA excision repair protein ERCC-2
MDDESRAEFLDHLAVPEADSDGVTAFCVLGGVFAEGIDLPGRRIDGAIITGVALPAVSLDREIIKDYFEETTGHGFLYAYVYPGMNRIIQAGGRVIRSETDRGVIILAGRRLSQQPYRRILEEVWPDAVECRDSAALTSMVREFRESR